MPDTAPGQRDTLSPSLLTMLFLCTAPPRAPQTQAHSVVCVVGHVPEAGSEAQLACRTLLSEWPSHRAPWTRRQVPRTERRKASRPQPLPAPPEFGTRPLSRPFRAGPLQPPFIRP